MVPALKLPLASLCTTADAVLAFVEVVHVGAEVPADVSN
jgi:hypothetical protein